jgi:hypothetical protein
MSDGFFGQLTTTDANDSYNAHRFQTKQQIAEVRVGIPLKVVAVHGGGLGPPPTVDVQPIINQMDSQGNATPHGTIFNIPAPRLQNVYGAVIIDPVVGDVGHGVPSDRDHSSAQSNNWAQSNPGSFRRHDLSDLVYHPGTLNGGTPSQYLWFQDGVVTLSDSNGNIVQMKDGRLTINPGSGNVYLGGDGSTGTYALVMTESGVSTNVMTRIG